MKAIGRATPSTSARLPRDRRVASRGTRATMVRLGGRSPEHSLRGSQMNATHEGRGWTRQSHVGSLTAPHCPRSRCSERFAAALERSRRHSAPDCAHRDRQSIAFASISLLQVPSRAASRDRRWTMSRLLCVLFTAALFAGCGGAATDVADEKAPLTSETQQAWCSGDLCDCYDPPCTEECPPAPAGQQCLAACRRAQLQCAKACCSPY
jgi:hypothetical protein